MLDYLRGKEVLELVCDALTNSVSVLLVYSLMQSAQLIVLNYLLLHYSVKIVELIVSNHAILAGKQNSLYFDID